jgi:hypothetical protein
MTLQEIRVLLLDPITTSWILPIILAGALGLAGKILRPKEKVIWSNLRQFAFLFSGQPPTGANSDGQQPSLIYTRTVLLQNAGKAVATNVEVYFVHRPEKYQLWPAVTYRESNTPEGNFVVTIERLVPGETLSIELLQAHLELPDVMRVRSTDRVAREVAMHWQKVPSKKMLALVLILFALGFFTIGRFVVWLMTLAI